MEKICAKSSMLLKVVFFVLCVGMFSALVIGITDMKEQRQKRKLIIKLNS